MWWQHREWRFVADMNRDGAVTMGDVELWWNWLFYLPGDALIAQLGPTALGRSLELTPASFASPLSALISAVLWLLAAWVLAHVPGVVQDVIDPTWRTQRREWRQAQARRQRI